MLTGLDVAVAAVLLVAGIGKLYAPWHLRSALAEIFLGSLTAEAIRLFAAIEVATALALLVPASRLPAAMLAGALGISFAAFGALGMLRGSSVSCGCLARSDGRPLGPPNIVVGLCMALIAGSNLLLPVPSFSERHYTELSVTGTALGGILLAIWGHKELVLGLMRHGVDRDLSPS